MAIKRKNPSMVRQTAHAIWDIPNHADFSTASEFAPSTSYGANNGPVYLPDGALILDSWYYVETTAVAQDGTDDPTIALGYTGSTAAIIAAIAINDSDNPWDAHAARYGKIGTPEVGSNASTLDTGTQILMQVERGSKITPLTGDKELLLTVGVDGIDEGKIHLFVDYVLTGDLG